MKVTYHVISNIGKAYTVKKTTRYFWGIVKIRVFRVYIWDFHAHDGEFKKAIDLETGKVLGYFDSLEKLRNAYRAYTMAHLASK